MQIVRDNLNETAPAKFTRAGQILLSTGANAGAARSFVWGTALLTTNAGGDVNLGNEVASVHNLTTIFIVVAWNGDGASRPNMVIAKQTEPGTYDTSWNVRCWNGDTGAVIASANVRIDYIAVGL